MVADDLGLMIDTVRDRGGSFDAKISEASKTAHPPPHSVENVVPSSSSAAPTARGPPSTNLQEVAKQPPISTQSVQPVVSKSISSESYRDSDPYWKKPLQAQSTSGDLVVIHVCDENQQVSRDFCCNRSILVNNMRYFERFLGENEGAYEDIDISVHCDVEIFEWLMTYIHDPKHQSTRIDKSIIISILISSEFLQMDELVEVCIEQVASNLNDIIRLPIDLSCVSEKLVNRIAAITHPKTLCDVKDKKDKILTKLYKRRVELDFSRKGSSAKSTTFITNRTIASSLTCCRYCGWVYLESYNTSLVCRQSQPSIDFRGRLTSRHAAIPSWSLTSYLKTLHSGGMGWDAIYWHVWAACIILRIDNLTISALEVDRYSIEPDGLMIRSCPSKTVDIALKPVDEAASAATASGDVSPRPNGISAYAKALSAHLNPDPSPPTFSLGLPESLNIDVSAKMPISYKAADWINLAPYTTPSLHPARPPDVLTSEIFDLLCSQMKFITGLPHRNLLQQTMQQMISSAARADTRHARLPTGVIDFMDILYGAPQEQYGGIREEIPGVSTDAAEERRRGRSPARVAPRPLSLEPRRGMSKARSVSLLPNVSSGNSTPQGNPSGSSSNADYDSDGIEATTSTRRTASALGERRARSSSTGKRVVGLAPTSSSTGAAPPGTSGGTRSAGSSSKKKNDGVAMVSMEVGSDEEEIGEHTVDGFIAHQIEILKSMPADLAYKTSQQRAAVHGVWLTANPLQIHPPALDEMLQVVTESSLPDNKKLEWELDLMREFDERRIDRIERYLISTRQAPSVSSVDLSSKAKLSSSKGGKFKGEYYRDRGRQAFRCVS